METNTNQQINTLQTTSDVLDRLTSSLDDFEEISPDLAPLNGTGGRCGAVMVVDMEYFVMVNAEGFNYPRYRSPQISGRLIGYLEKADYERLCIRKATFPPGFKIATKEQLEAFLHAPYDFVQR